MTKREREREREKEKKENTGKRIKWEGKNNIKKKQNVVYTYKMQCWHTHLLTFSSPPSWLTATPTLGEFALY